MGPVLGPVLGPPGGCLELSWGVEERAGASWGPFWGLLEPERPEALLGLPGALLGLSWALLGLPGALLGLPGALLGALWGPWGSPRALVLGLCWGLSWYSPGALLGLSCAFLRRSWGSPGASPGALLGGLLEPERSGALLGPLGPSWGSPGLSWAFLALPGPLLGLRGLSWEFLRAGARACWGFLGLSSGFQERAGASSGPFGAFSMCGSVAWGRNHGLPVLSQVSSEPPGRTWEL